MYNSNNLPNNSISTQIFNGNSGDLQIWRKPPGTQLVHIICIGAGGGGGGGTTRASGVAGGGGAGGGSGAITNMTVDGFLCPDYLNVFVPQGGLGGGPGATGSSGDRSYVSIPLMGAYAYGGSVLIQSGNTLAIGGGGGKAAAASTGGAASNIFVSPTFGAYGNWISIGGQAGSNGSATTAGISVTWGTLFISGGAGGAGMAATNVVTSGGAITAPASGIFQTFNVTAAGSNGISGINILKPFPIFSGGSGGASSNVGPGGSGGKAGIGSGGGGGAAGLTGGNGGDGGDGLVIITCI